MFVGGGGGGGGVRGEPVEVLGGVGRRWNQTVRCLLAFGRCFLFRGVVRGEEKPKKKQKKGRKLEKRAW